LSGDATSLVNPVFDATVQYHPFEMTRISLTAQSVVSVSYLNNWVVETAGIKADLNQQLPWKFYLDVNGGYDQVKYVFSGSGTDPDRRDNCPYLNVRLGRAFLRRGNVALIYQLSTDDSTQPGYSFTSNQVGFQIDFIF
jgi:hypothetical protein